MDYRMGSGGEQRLHEFIDRVGRHGPPCDCSCAQHVAPEMPDLSLHEEAVVPEDRAHPVTPLSAEMTQQC